MPKELTCAQTGDALEALFVGDPMPHPSRVRDHLRRCARCRAWFEDLAQSDLELREHPEEAPLPQDSFQRRYTQALLEEAAQPQVAPWWHRPRLLAALRWWRARPLPTAVAGAVAGAVALLLAGVLAAPSLWPAPDPAPTFTPRSAQSTQSAQAAVGVWQLEVFCVRRQAPGQRPGFLARDVESRELRCRPEDELKVTYLNHASQGDPMGYLALYSRSPTGELRWHLPAQAHSPQSVSMPIGPSQRIAPLGQTLRLDRRHGPGQWELRGLFTRAPLPRAAMEAHLANQDDPRGASWRGPDGQRAGLNVEGRDYLVRSARFQIVEEGP